MARPISDEELQLKRRARRRLIGAIVLVAAIVVALPMVLDTEPKPMDGEISIKIPPPDSSKFASSRVVPVPPTAEPRSATGEKSQTDTKSTSKFAAAVGEKPAAVAPDAAKVPEAPPAPRPQPAAPKAPAVAEAPARKEAEKAPNKPAAVPPVPAASESGAQLYSVQVVALADAEKVKQVQEQMAAAGLKSYTEVVKTAKGDVTRVRAGPYSSRAAAEKAHDQLKTLGLSGNIVAK
jgi:DedD protein